MSRVLVPKRPQAKLERQMEVSRLHGEMMVQAYELVAPILRVSLSAAKAGNRPGRKPDTLKSCAGGYRA